MKILGSVSINIKEWPISQAKRDKVRMSPQATLDLQITYNYTPKSMTMSYLDENLE